MEEAVEGDGDRVGDAESAVRAKSEMSQARFWCAEVTGCSCLASARATPTRKPLSMEETCVRRAGGGAWSRGRGSERGG